MLIGLLGGALVALGVYLLRPSNKRRLWSVGLGLIGASAGIFYGLQFVNVMSGSGYGFLLGFVIAFGGVGLLVGGAIDLLKIVSTRGKQGNSSVYHTPLHADPDAKASKVKSAPLPPAPEPQPPSPQQPKVKAREHTPLYTPLQMFLLIVGGVIMTTVVTTALIRNSDSQEQQSQVEDLTAEDFVVDEATTSTGEVRAIEANPDAAEVGRAADVNYSDETDIIPAEQMDESIDANDYKMARDIAKLGYTSNQISHMVGPDIPRGVKYNGFILNLEPKVEDVYIVKGMFDKAASIYLRNASNDIDAAHNIGLMYARGLGVKRDSRKALTFLELSYNGRKWDADSNEIAKLTDNN